MITMRERGERIRRRYPASIAKMGKGTLYITTRRVVFESADRGVCLDLHFQWLYEWYPTARRKCRLSWLEPDPETKDVRLSDKPFECEIVLERRADKWKPDPIEFHYSLCFAYTEWVDNEQMQSGWYIGADDKVRNHYRLAGPKQKTVDEYPGDDSDPYDPPLKYQKVFHGVDTRKEMHRYFQDATGERLIDQELKWRGWDDYYDGVHNLAPAMTHPGKKVIPYEPEFDRLKEYYPAWRQPTREDLEDAPGWNLRMRSAVLDAHMYRIRDGIKKGTLADGSQELKNERRRYNRSSAEYVRDYKLAGKLSEMKFETSEQWIKVIRAANESFKESGISESDDYGAICDYEPLIIDMPPVEPYKNEALEEKQNYRRLLVEAA